MELLVSALRQYRHNNSDDFVFAYDKDETERIIDQTVNLLKNLVVWSEHVSKRAGVRMNDPCTGSMMEAKEFIDSITPKVG